MAFAHFREIGDFRPQYCIFREFWNEEDPASNLAAVVNQFHVGSDRL